MNEIFIVDLFYKDTRKHTYTYFKTLEGARKYAVNLLGYTNTIVMIHPNKLYN